MLRVSQNFKAIKNYRNEQILIRHYRVISLQSLPTTMDPTNFSKSYFSYLESFWMDVIHIFLSSDCGSNISVRSVLCIISYNIVRGKHSLSIEKCQKQKSWELFILQFNLTICMLRSRILCKTLVCKWYTSI